MSKYINILYEFVFSVENIDKSQDNNGQRELK